MLVAVIGAAALAGCALRDPRLDYAYSRAIDPIAFNSHVFGFTIYF